MTLGTQAKVWGVALVVFVALLELLKGIVSLSRPLGLAVTIEGVETFEQLKILAHEIKPDFVQGFLFVDTMRDHA